MPILIGLHYDMVKIIPYCSEWKKCFEEEKTGLLSILGDNVIDIQHIGSTSVPGLVAKPIIDMMVGFRNFYDSFKYIEKLEEQGYKFLGIADIRGRLFLVKGNEEITTHHLHIVEYGSELWLEQLAFKEYLCKNAKVAKEYAQLKQKLAEKFEFDRDSYTSAKADFVRNIINKSLMKQE